MKITKKQLRRIIKEACALSDSGQDQAAQPLDPISQLLAPHEEEAASDHFSPEVPVPEDYDKTRDFLEQNPELVDLGLSIVMDGAGTGCERSTAQGVIDHLQDMLGTGDASQNLEIPLEGA